MSHKKKVTRGNPANHVTTKQQPANKSASSSSNWKPSGSLVSNNSANMNSGTRRKQKVRWKKVIGLLIVIGMAVSLFAALLVATPNPQAPVSPYNAPDISQIE